MLYHRLRRANENFIFAFIGAFSIVLQFCVMKCNAFARRKKKAMANDFTFYFSFAANVSTVKGCMHRLHSEYVLCLHSHYWKRQVSLQLWFLGKLQGIVG